jgi:hypothetical protein
MVNDRDEGESVLGDARLAGPSYSDRAAANTGSGSGSSRRSSLLHA